MTSPSDAPTHFPLDYVSLNYLETQKAWKVVCKFDAAHFPAFMDLIGGPGGNLKKLAVTPLPDED